MPGRKYRSSPPSGKPKELVVSGCLGRGATEDCISWIGPGEAPSWKRPAKWMLGWGWGWNFTHRNASRFPFWKSQFLETFLMLSMGLRSKIYFKPKSNTKSEMKLLPIEMVPGSLLDFCKNCWCQRLEHWGVGCGMYVSKIFQAKSKTEGRMRILREAR